MLQSLITKNSHNCHESQDKKKPYLQAALSGAYRAPLVLNPWIVLTNPSGSDVQHLSGPDMHLSPAASEAWEH